MVGFLGMKCVFEARNHAKVSSVFQAQITWHLLNGFNFFGLKTYRILRPPHS